jgi:hypothetical protein
MSGSAPSLRLVQYMKASRSVLRKAPAARGDGFTSGYHPVLMFLAGVLLALLWAASALALGLAVPGG